MAAYGQRLRRHYERIDSRPLAFTFARKGVYREGSVSRGIVHMCWVIVRTSFSWVVKHGSRGLIGDGGGEIGIGS